MMTVRELIEHLSQFDSNLGVKIEDANRCLHDIEFVQMDDVQLDAGFTEEAVILEVLQ